MWLQFYVAIICRARRALAAVAVIVARALWLALITVVSRLGLFYLWLSRRSFGVWLWFWCRSRLCAGSGGCFFIVVIRLVNPYKRRKHHFTCLCLQHTGKFNLDVLIKLLGSLFYDNHGAVFEIPHTLGAVLANLSNLNVAFFAGQVHGA